MITKYAVLRQYNSEGCLLILQRVRYNDSGQRICPGILKQIKGKFPDAQFLFFVGDYKEYCKTSDTFFQP